MFDPFEDYKYAIADRCQDLAKSGKSPKDYDNYDLAKIAEYYSAIQLNKDETKSPFLLYEDVPVNFKQRLHLTALDTGIDLCNCDNAIVQVKLRANVLNSGELGTFFSSNLFFDEQTNQRQYPFKREILYRNSDSKLSSTLNTYLRKRRTEDMTFEREDVLTYCQDLLDNPLPKRIRKEPEFCLRDYQIEAIDLVCKTDTQNCILCLPTGCGKNAIMIFAMKQMMSLDKRTKFLVLVPRIILMDQLYDEIIRFMPDLEKQYICLLGDGSNEFDEKARICVCVFNSFELIPETQHTKFTRIFVDEAHHIYRPKIYQDDLDLDMEDDDDVEQEEKEEFDSETEEDGDDQEESESESASEEDTQTSSTDEEVKITFLDKIRRLAQTGHVVCLSATIDRIPGWVYFKKEVREMIDRGFLCDYQFRIPLFSSKVTLDVIAKYLVTNFRSIIIYAKNCKEGTEFCKAMNSYMNGCCEYIDCHTSRSNRKCLLSLYESGTLPFILNVRVLCEGFNAPITQGVYFHHITSSDTTIIQIIGRCLRLHPSKTMAQIILPTATDEDNTMIHRFIKEVAKTDSRLKECFMNKKYGLYVTTEIGNLDEAELEADEIFQKGELIYNSFGQYLNYHDMWIYNLQQVIKFVEENNKRPSQKSKNADVKRLGTWVSTQLTNRKTCAQIMQDESIRKMWDSFTEHYHDLFLSKEESWKSNLQQVVKFVEENKKKPTSISKNADEKILGRWLVSQLMNRKKCSCIMQDESIREMWDLFTEQYNDLFLSNEESWECKLQQVVKFIEENNKRPSQKSKNADEKILGQWVTDQLKNRKQCLLIMKKESIQKMWDSFTEQYSDLFLPNDEAWRLNLQQLTKFVEENKKRPSGGSTNAEEKKLGSWVTVQVRTRKKLAYIMKDEKIRMLWDSFTEQYDDLFSSNEEVWTSNFQQLVKFVEEHKKRPSEDSKNQEETRLKSWAACQLQNRKKCSYIMQEENIRTMWDSFIEQNHDLFLSNEEVWTSKLQQLVKFVEEHKKRPSTHSKNADEKRLGTWVTNQLKNRKKCSYIMQEENIRTTWDSFIERNHDLFLSNEEVWTSKLQQVVKFIEENKKRPSDHSKNEDEKSLGSWLSKQVWNRKQCLYIMEDVDILHLWDSFIEKYNDLFLSNGEVLVSS